VPIFAVYKNSGPQLDFLRMDFRAGINILARAICASKRIPNLNGNSVPIQFSGSVLPHGGKIRAFMLVEPSGNERFKVTIDV
jgi:hypothetical protein